MEAAYGHWPVRAATSTYHASVALEPHRGLPWLALTLLVPAPSIGVALAMAVPATTGTHIGSAAYAFAKVWLAAFPLFWLLVIEKGRISFSPAKRGGVWVGAALGLVISALILGAYVLLGDSIIDPETVRAKAAENQLNTLTRFILVALYLTFINALLEEYVWRWFVFRQCEKAMGERARWFAVLLSALLFTVHHVIALMVQFDWTMTVLGSLGVFIGGATWSWCYLKYRSIWPGYISHLIVDAAIFVIAWKLIFGG